MLSRPFRGLPRGRLIFMLVLFLLLEGALGAGLYENNRTSAATTPPAPVLGSVLLRNSSHIVVFGHHAKFAASVSAHKEAYVVYTIHMPDGTQESARELTDRTGYSAYTFFIHYTPRAGVANTVTVTVSYNGQPQASSAFPVEGVAP